VGTQVRNVLDQIRKTDRPEVKQALHMRAANASQVIVATRVTCGARDSGGRDSACIRTKSEL
jgi:hypothetical protein